MNLQEKIDLLNKLKHEKNTDKLCELIMKYYSENETFLDFNTIITADDAESMLLNITNEKGAIERLRYFLPSERGLTDNYYYINGYGNLEHIDGAILDLELEMIEDEIIQDEK